MENKTQKMILVRGASGSGKSTFAHALASSMNAKVFETDDFFIRDGKYIFDPTQLGAAHKWNQRRVWKALTEGKNVIVANTLTTLREIKDYTSMAEELNIPVTVYRSEGKFKNTHGVPEDKVAAMRARMVNYPGEIIINQ